METQCPNCGRRFRITESQLARAGGKVRCGACLQVFAGPDNICSGGSGASGPGAQEANPASRRRREAKWVRWALVAAIVALIGQIVWYLRFN